MYSLMTMQQDETDTSNDTLVTFEQVNKTFYDPKRGEVHALAHVSVNLNHGVCCLLGENGAGKSTMLRMLAGLLLPDTGHVSVCGHDTRTEATAVRQKLGYLSLSTNCYPRLTGREMLAYAGCFHGLSGNDLEERIQTMCETFALYTFLDQRCDSMSTGQRQRINLARTLLSDPAVLVLDEPTTGLDLVAARRMIDAVHAMRRPDRCIVLCTHLLHEAEELADRVVVLHQGHVSFDGPSSKLGSGDAFAHAVESLVRDPQSTKIQLS